MKTYRTIQVAGFTNKNTATLWDGREIITATSYDVEDFDFGADAEKELENCKNFIKKMEQEQGWIEGNVTCWIDEFTPEIEEEGGDNE